MSYPASGETTLRAFLGFCPGQRKIYEPKRRLNGVRCESLRTFINSSFHMRSLQLVLKIVLPDTRAGVIFR